MNPSTIQKVMGLGLRCRSALRPVCQRLPNTTVKSRLWHAANVQVGPIKRFASTTVTQATAAAVAASKEAVPVSVTKPAVAYWLYFNAGLVYAIVVVGGLTRLTESGLSITEWNVISGMKPPRSEQEWVEEFEKYKQYPEYKILNRHMELKEFKTIFYWEWSHRMIGRFIGGAFILPGLYFASRGYMTKRVAKQAFGITALLGFQ
ncbi:Cytochrome c oxidase assembly protein cox15, partial [Apophysomyces sp. BC1015]